MLAIVAPGQGSQTPGFLLPWLEVGETSLLLEKWSQLIDLDLRHLGTTADAEEIKETSNAQPLLVAAGLIAYAALFPNEQSSVTAVAGHSVGEITTAALAGVINNESAMKLVRARGAAMSQAATGSNSGMAAVLGGERDDVLAHLATLNLVAANENGAGQIVAAGSLEAIAQLLENAPTGSRVRPLAVSGAFHTAVMAPAVPVLAALAAEIHPTDPKIKVLSNKDGQVVSSGADIVARIVGQVAGPVRWDLCMTTLSDMGITGVLEVPPAGTLVGLLKRATPNIETFALKNPEDLAAAQEFIAKHGAN